MRCVEKKLKSKRKIMKTALLTLTTLLLSTHLYASTSASAKLESRSGSKTTGQIDFSQAADGLKIDYKVMGLAPNSSFGFHVHEKGDCSSPNAKSAGSHFHKIAEKGGTSIETPGEYAGDLPQLKSDAKGVAQGSVTVTQLSLNGENAIDGLSVMVHGGPDNVKEQSPPRIACGVIRSAKN
jgi:superoxide dismutase, Cu-Zn family